MASIAMMKKAWLGPMRPRGLALLTALATVAAAAPAFAAEAEEKLGGPFSGDIGNALWTVLTFVLVLVVLGRFAWGPLLKSLQARENFIREALGKADQDRREAEARLKEYHEKLASARAEASAIVDEGRRDADVLKHKIEEDAKREADQLIERAKREIGIAQETATKELYTLSAKLATGIAAKILEREIGPQDHERLIAESIANLPASGAPGRSH
jgi:F-type H+-transporting ATPase subunit b